MELRAIIKTVEVGAEEFVAHSFAKSQVGRTNTDLVSAVEDTLSFG